MDAWDPLEKKPGKDFKDQAIVCRKKEVPMECSSRQLSNQTGELDQGSPVLYGGTKSPEEWKV